MLALLTGLNQAAAQGAHFFRISGPTATKITVFRRDGTLVWSNATPGANYTVQTVSSLPGRSNWVDYNQIYPTNSVNTNQINAFNLPAGMALIPAGSFTMGNSTGDSDITGRNPINVTVSTFYMDVNLVTVSLDGRLSINGPRTTDITFWKLEAGRRINRFMAWLGIVR